MGKRGPKPKPTALKILEGNPSKRPLNENEPTYSAMSLECPDYLDDVSREVWDRLAGPMVLQGLLTVADKETFVSFCISFSRYLEAERGVSEMGIVVKTPNDAIILNPFVNASAKYLSAMNRAANELGLTPAARARLVSSMMPSRGSGSRPAHNSEKEIEVDVMDALLNEVDGYGT